MRSGSQELRHPVALSPSSRWGFSTGCGLQRPLCTERASLKATPKGHVHGLACQPRGFPTLGARMHSWPGDTDAVWSTRNSTDCTLGFESWLHATCLSELQENDFMSRSPGCPPAPKGPEAAGLNEVIMFTAGPARGTGSASTGNEHQNPEGLGDEGRHPMIPCTPFHAPHPLGFLSPLHVLGSLSPHPSCPPAWRSCLPSPLPGIFHGPGQP